MTYRGVRGSSAGKRERSIFEVSKVRIGSDGHISEVVWGEMGAGSDQHVGVSVVVSTAEVVDAIHDGAQVAAVFSSTNAGGLKHLLMRTFVVVEHEDGRESITFEGPPSPGRELVDMPILDH